MMQTCSSVYVLTISHYLSFLALIHYEGENRPNCLQTLIKQLTDRAGLQDLTQVVSGKDFPEQQQIRIRLLLVDLLEWPVVTEQTITPEEKNLLMFKLQSLGHDPSSEVSQAAWKALDKIRKMS